MNWMKKYVIYLLESSGCWLMERDKWRNLITLISYSVYALLYFFGNTAVICSYLVFVIGSHFLFFFGFLGSVDLRKKWVEKYGPQKAFHHFKTICALSFFMYFTSGTLITFQMPFSDALSFIPRHLMIGLGVAIMSVGLFFRLWAIDTVGLDKYYMKDFFVTPKKTEYTLQGPYKYFSHPMYGVGYLVSYGFCLASGALIPFCITALCQFMMLLFAYKIESPHIKNIYLSAE